MQRMKPFLFGAIWLNSPTYQRPVFSVNELGCELLSCTDGLFTPNFAQEQQSELKTVRMRVFDLIEFPCDFLPTSVVVRNRIAGINATRHLLLRCSQQHCL